MKRPVCSSCGAVFDSGSRRVQESVDDAAVKAGWTLGLPRGRAFCPYCDPRNPTLEAPDV